MKSAAGLMFAAMALPSVAVAGEAGDALAKHLYAGTAAKGLPAATEQCYRLDQEACFAEGMFQLVLAYEGLASDLYRYGAVVPGSSSAAMLLGMGPSVGAVPANSHPEKLSYDGLRTMLVDFVADLDQARISFERAGQAGDYVIMLDPLTVRIDFDGNGVTEPSETLGALLHSTGELFDIPTPDAPPPGKSKSKPVATDSTIGFDRADAIWFAGYLQATAAPVDLILAHDFSGFYDAYLHRVFPLAGLPMQDYSTGSGTLFLNPETDTDIADIIGAIHTLDFPVTDKERLSGVLDRLRSITALSRQNWQLILAETDDNRELVPSPDQTSIVPGMDVTQETVDAWIATLDTVDEVLAGDLLVPHWRFQQGFDLKSYFQTATETDLVLLLTGSGAVPFLKDGPVADARSFAQANRVFGTEWLNYVFWFN